MTEPTNAAPAPLSNQMRAIDNRFGPITYRPIESLTSYEPTLRKHPERQLVKLSASIAEFGFAIPVLIDEAGVIIAGEARVNAARRLGMSEVPVIVAEQWSKAQVRAYRLADNRLAELASWDEEALAIELASIIELDEVEIQVLGWDTAEIDLILEGDAAAEAAADPADDQIEPPAVPVTRTGDLWLLGKHRLLCGSSLDRPTGQS